MTSHSISELADGLRSVSACMAKDNSRYAISGVLAEPHADGLRLVATDGHRLAIARVPGLQIEGLTKPVILSGAAVKAMTGRAKSMAIDIQITDSGVTVKTQTGSLQFEHIEGQFPPYRDVIPAQVVPHAVVPPVSPQLLASATAWAPVQGFKLFATHPSSKGRAVLAISPNHPNWLLVIMPVNVQDAGIWTAKDGEAYQALLGKTMTVLEPEPAEAPATEAAEVAGTVGTPAVRKAA